jgi:hypothetical protein
MMDGPWRAPSSPPETLEERIAAVDDDVAGFEQREQMLDEFVHGAAGLHHEHDATGTFQEADHLGQRMGADDLGALRLVGEEGVHLVNRAVEGHDGEAVVVHVQDQVLAHDGQADDGDVSARFHVRCSVESSSAPGRRAQWGHDGRARRQATGRKGRLAAVFCVFCVGIWARDPGAAGVSFGAISELTTARRKR